MTLNAKLAPIAVVAAILSCSTPIASAVAQMATFTGQVRSSSGLPLGGANVGIRDLGVGAVTAADGRYNFNAPVSGAAERLVVLVARYIGYKPREDRVPLSPGRTDHDFVLERDVLNLESVVITGTSGATSQKMTPFSVAVVDNTTTKEVPAASPLGALAGKVAGASFVTLSGQPGTAPAIRLRSATSLLGSSDPLVIIDGTISRISLADINSEDIERIEVIKGAAASSLYGSDAANGVVQIFTKRGDNLAQGQTSFTTRTEYGRNDLTRVVQGNMHHNYKVLCGSSPCVGSDASSSSVSDFDRNANGARVSEDDLISDNAYPVYYDQLRDVFRPSEFLTTYGSFGQRHGPTNLHVSFENQHDSGVLRLLNGYRRQNFRVNIDQSLAANVDVRVGAFYARSHADQGEDYGSFFALRYLEPNVRLDSIAVDCPPTVDDCPWLGAFNPVIKQAPLSGNVANPLYLAQQQSVTNDRDRFNGTFQGTYRPFAWLTGEASVGYDEANRTYKRFAPVGFTNSSGAPGQGSLFQQADGNRAYNANITLTSSRDFGESVHNTTRAAYQYEDQTNAYVNVQASQLAVPRVPEFTAADPSGTLIADSRTETIRANDAFLVSTFELKQRYIVDGLIRKDRSSLFGADERTQIYHRLSGAWRVTEDFRLPRVQELKLRISHGTAGLRPPFIAQYEVISIVGGKPTKIVAGNSKLKPAYSTENEYGFDVHFLRNYSLDYSYSRKRTTDQMLRVPLSATTGYKFQWQNVGTLEGHTHELAFGTVLVSQANYFWRLGITGDRTRQRITELPIAPFLFGPGGVRIAAGETYGIFSGTKWIRTEADLVETIRTGNLTGIESDYQRNEEGFFVRRSEYHTINEQPLRFWQCTATDAAGACTESTDKVQIGDGNPDFNMGFNSIVQWKSLSASATLTWVKGGNIYNVTRQAPFNELRDRVIDQSDKPDPGLCPALSVDPNCPYGTGRKPTTYYSTFYNNDGSNSYFVESGTHVKLREVALNWQVPARWIARTPIRDFHTIRLGVVGRNLWTKTKYSGYDPDVTGWSDIPFGNRVDFFRYPAYRTFSAMLEIGY